MPASTEWEREWEHIDRPESAAHAATALIRSPRAIVIRDGQWVIPDRAPAPPVDARARGTQDLPKTVPDSLGTDWYYSLKLEFLGKNLAVAGGLEYAYRLGLAHDEQQRTRFGRRKIGDKS